MTGPTRPVPTGRPSTCTVGRISVVVPAKNTSSASRSASTGIARSSTGTPSAADAGVEDAILVRDGMALEGTHNNFFAVFDGAVTTSPASNYILHGITRAAVLRMAREAQMQVEERPFTMDEAKAADEAFITSASTFVMPVVEIDGAAIGTGQPGAVTARLREIYLDEMRKAAI